MNLAKTCLYILVAQAVCLLPQTGVAEPLSYPGDKNYGWVVTSYFDQGGTSDWNCGGNTYSGHKGTDFAILGSWSAMAEGRPVLAAAAGTVEVTHDGEPDMCMSGNCGGGSGWGNHIRIAHPDGTRTLYAHLKTWSVSVAEGEQVACGQEIGLVGSSGNSTGPHLHFEKRAAAEYASVRDPFVGPCSPGPGDWIEQGGYNDLPGAACPDVVVPWPDLSLDVSGQPIDGQDPDFNPEGNSQGIFDAYVGQQVEIAYTLTNGTDNTDVAFGVRVGFELSPQWSVSDWLILDNWPQNACGGEWCPNDSNDKPENLPPEQLADTFSLELGPLSPGEGKRVVLTLTADVPTAPDTHAQAAYYVAHVDDVYEKASFDAQPNNVDDKQTWGGGDLRLLFEADLYDEPDAGTTDATDSDTTGDTTDASATDVDTLDSWGPGTAGSSGTGETGPSTETSSATSADPSASDSALPPGFGGDGDLSEEGCACTQTSGPPPILGLLLLAIGLRRRRSPS